jgi:predicted PurR-regulated permease PerM
MNRTSPSIRKPRGSSPWVIAALVLAALIAYESGNTVAAVLLVLALVGYLVVRPPAVRKTKKAAVIVVGASILGVLLVGVVVLIAVVISTGEQQSHEWQRQVATVYAAAKSGAPESTVREQLNEPFAVHKHVLPANPAADVHCLIYRVLLPTVELVPYHFCYTHHRLVTKYRGWDNIPDD